MERRTKNTDANQKLQKEFKEAILPWYQEVTEENPWAFRLKSLKPFDKGEEDSLLEEILNAGPELVDSLIDLANARDDGRLLPSLPRKSAIDRLGELYLKEKLPIEDKLKQLLWNLANPKNEEDQGVRYTALENLVDHRKGYLSDLEEFLNQKEVIEMTKVDPYYRFLLSCL